MAELLLELLSEEIPARMQARGAAELRRLVTEGLGKAGLSFETAQAFVTPRRLALVVQGLPKKTEPGKEVRKGPRVDAPQKAIDGFLRSVARANVEHPEIKIQKSDKGEFYVFEALIAAKPTEHELSSLIRDALEAFSWPKSMRWKPGQTQTWVRPLHSILAVFDGKQLALEYHLIHSADVVANPTEENTIRAGDKTVGHRFLAPKAFKVKAFADYTAKLEKAKVMLDPAARRAAIVKQAKARAARAKLTVKDDPSLLNEVAGLVEWPVVLIGRIDDQYMDLPPEVLTTAMRAHQKYLALTDAKGGLANRFLVVANMETADKGKAIVAGNERVLRARLADARFFWDQDRKATLASRAPALGQIVFHAKLGTLDEKIDRVQALAAAIAGFVPGADKDRVRSAARLAKADLVTGMVGEFPELQGIMGRYYALHDGEDAGVAKAIAEHYSPLGPGEACPSAPLSVALALADKIDTLTGFFVIDEKPTGSKDPYALRRAALGVIRLIVENEVRLPLRGVLETAKKLVEGTLLRRGSIAAISKPVPGWGEIDRDVLAVLDFLADRLKVALKDKGVRHDLISAVFALGGEDDLVRLLARVRALESFFASDDGANLLTAYRRAANIVRIEEKRDKSKYDGGADAKALRQREEKALFKALDAASKAAEKALGGEDFTGAMAALSKLRRPVDDFFDQVTVNTDERDLRANRLRLLARIDATLNRVADFSKVEG